ncbi:hypothetical protein CLOM_g9994 [Closterium sp. NIES-68]|nr:hypothetical protein CLOM_g9994 [Closterium sp. NIES-68]
MADSTGRDKWDGTGPTRSTASVSDLMLGEVDLSGNSALQRFAALAAEEADRARGTAHSSIAAAAAAAAADTIIPDVRSFSVLPEETAGSGSSVSQSQPEGEDRSEKSSQTRKDGTAGASQRIPGFGPSGSAAAPAAASSASVHPLHGVVTVPEIPLDLLRLIDAAAHEGHPKALTKLRRIAAGLETLGSLKKGKRGEGKAEDAVEKPEEEEANGEKTKSEKTGGEDANGGGVAKDKEEEAEEEKQGQGHTEASEKDEEAMGSAERGTGSEGKEAETQTGEEALGKEETSRLIVETLLAIMGGRHEEEEVGQAGAGREEGGEGLGSRSSGRNGSIGSSVGGSTTSSSMGGSIGGSSVGGGGGHGWMKGGPVIMLTPEAARLGAWLLPWLPCHEPEPEPADSRGIETQTAEKPESDVSEGVLPTQSASDGADSATSAAHPPCADAPAADTPSVDSTDPTAEPTIDPAAKSSPKPASQPLPDPANPKAALAPAALVSPRTRMARGIARVLLSCTRNRALCASMGLVRALLAALRVILLGGVDAQGLPPAAATADALLLPGRKGTSSKSEDSCAEASTEASDSKGDSADSGRSSSSRSAVADQTGGEAGSIAVVRLFGVGEAAWDCSPLVTALESLAAHSLNVAELQEWMRSTEALILPAASLAAAAPPPDAAAVAAAGADLDNPRSSTCSSSSSGLYGSSRAALLLTALERAMAGEEARGPSHSFELDGRTSGLLGPGDSKWPFSNGYAVATWLYVESFVDTSASAITAAAKAAAIAAAITAKGGKGSAQVTAAQIAAAVAAANSNILHLPRLYSFLTIENHGIEAYFHKDTLVVESNCPWSGIRNTVRFRHTFLPRRWYFLALEHIFKPSLMGKAESEIRLYVNGRLIEACPLDLPRIANPLGFLCIGTNPPSRLIFNSSQKQTGSPAHHQHRQQRLQCPLFAELGPVYIFKEPIGSERIARLAVRGGDHLPVFGAGAGAPAHVGSEVMMRKAEESYGLDLDLAPSLHLLYHPKMLLGRFCPDASPAIASGASHPTFHSNPNLSEDCLRSVVRNQNLELFHSTCQSNSSACHAISPLPTLLFLSGVQRRPAEVVGQVHVAARRRAADALWAATEGGPLALLPLCIEAVDLHTMAPQVRSPPLSLSASQLLPHVLRLIARSLRRPMNREELKGAGPTLLSHLLQFVLSSPPTLNESASIRIAPAASSSLSTRGKEKDKTRDRDKELVHACMLLAHLPRPGDHLKNHLMEHLLLHLPLWAPSHLSTQRALLAAIGDAVPLELQALQSVGAVSLLLDGCRRCYWMTWEPSSVRLCTASWHSNAAGAKEKGAGGAAASEAAGEAGGAEWGREDMHGEREGMMGEVNGMVNAVMAVLEKLVSAGVGLAVMGADMRALVSFALQCPQANQVARVLLLLYRLMSQPNSSRASAFMVQFLAAGGAEMLLALLLRETQYGETYPVTFPAKSGRRPIRRRLVPAPGGEGLDSKVEGEGGEVEGDKGREERGRSEDEEESARKVLVFADGKGGAAEGQGGEESGEEVLKEGAEGKGEGGKEGDEAGAEKDKERYVTGEDSEKACEEGVPKEGRSEEGLSEKESKGKEEEEEKKEEEASKPKQEAVKAGGVWDMSTWNAFLEPLGLKVGAIDEKKTDAGKPGAAASKEGGKRDSKAAAGAVFGNSGGLPRDTTDREGSGVVKELEKGSEENREEEDVDEDTRRGLEEVAAVVQRLSLKQVYEDDAEESAVQVTKEGVAVLAPWVCVSVPRLARTGGASRVSSVKSASSHASAADVAAAAAAAMVNAASWDVGGGSRGSSGGSSSRGIGASSSAGGSSSTVNRSGSGRADAVRSSSSESGGSSSSMRGSEGALHGRAAHRASSHGAPSTTAGPATAAGAAVSAAAAAADAFWLSGWMAEGTATATATASIDTTAATATADATATTAMASTDATASATAAATGTDFYYDSDQGFPLTDGPDAIMVAVISILGLLSDSGFLRLSNPSVLGVVPSTQGLGAVVTERAGKDRSNVGAWAVYGVQRALQLAPRRLLTPAVYHALMTAVLRCKAIDSPSALLPPSTFIAPWEQQLLLALLRALPAAAPHTQLAVLQDLLLLLSLNPANMRLLTQSPEWPEWLLEILLSNLEELPLTGSVQATAGQAGGRDDDKDRTSYPSSMSGSAAARSSTSVQEDVNELIFSFLGIVFEHCLTVKDGWKVLEATFQCLQWKALIGGSSVGVQLKRREAAMVTIHRRLLHEALDFTASHLPTKPPPPSPSLSSPPPSCSPLDILSPRSSSTPRPSATPTPAAAADSPPAAPSCCLENAVALLMLLEEFLRMQAEKRMDIGEEGEDGEEEGGDGLVEGQRVGKHGLQWTVVDEEGEGEGKRKPRPAAWSEPTEAAAAAAIPVTEPVAASAEATAEGTTAEGTESPAAAPAAPPAWSAEFSALDSEASTQTAPADSSSAAAAATAPASNGAGWVAEFPLIDLSSDALPAAAVTVTVTTTTPAPGAAQSASASSAASAPVDASPAAAVAVPAAAAAAGLHFDLLTGSFSPSNLPLQPTVSPPLGPLSSPPGSASLISLNSPQQQQRQQAQAQASPAFGSAMERNRKKHKPRRFKAVQSALASYGSIAQSLPDSWRRRCRLWFGEGVEEEGGEPVGWGGERGGKRGKEGEEGGGVGGSAEGSRTEVSALEQVLMELAEPPKEEEEEDEEEDEAGVWIDLRLVLKGVTILKGMLLEKEGVAASESGVLAVLGVVGGAGMSEALKGVLEDDQSLVTILRVVLVAARETDGGEMGGELVKKGVMEGEEVTEKVLSSLLWRVLAPLLTTSRLDQRQNCALSVAAILHTEIIHSIGHDGTILRPTFLSLLLPPFTALLRKWRPALRCLRLLSDHTGASPLSDPNNPALATDATPSEAALAFLSPLWVAAFASPPAAACLAATAAATGPSAAAADFVSSSRGAVGGFMSSSGGGAGGVSWSSSSSSGAGGAGRGGRERKLGLMDRLYGLTDGRQRVDGTPEGATSAKRRERGDIQRSSRWSLWDSLEGAWGDVIGLKHAALSAPFPVTVTQTAVDSTAAANHLTAAENKDGKSSRGGSSNISSSREWDEVEMRYSISLGPRVGGLQLFLASLHDLLSSQSLQTAKLHSPIIKARAAGGRMWRSLIRQLLKSGRLCGARSSHEEFRQSPVVCYLDRMETSLRMRRRVKPCFTRTATDGLRAAADAARDAVSVGAAGAVTAALETATVAAADSATAAAGAAAHVEAVQRLGGALPAPLGGFMRGGGEKGEVGGEEGEQVAKGDKEEEGKAGEEGANGGGGEEVKDGGVEEGGTEGAVIPREGSGSVVAEEGAGRKEGGDVTGGVEGGVKDKEGGVKGVEGGVKDVEGGGAAGRKSRSSGQSAHGEQRVKPGGMEWTLVADADGEEVLVDVAAMMVQPLRTVKGRLVVTTTRLWFHVDPLVQFRERGREEKGEKGENGETGGGGAGKQEESGQSDANQETPVPNGGVGRGVGGDGAVRGDVGDRVWRLSSVREVLTRRYLLRRSALEIFMIDRSNFFFACEGAEQRKRVHRAIERAHPPHFQHLFSASQRPENILEKLQLTKRWVDREITNFEYLMHLNTLAGRSFNDVTQYPVFPWVIQDYTSKELDLTKTATFRDLSKPMGALTQPRLGKLVERYASFDDPVIPRFHHGTHYSSAAIASHYLLRLEPFTSLALSLQGGKLDHPDRLFRDVASTWQGVTTDMADVKELIPEWFCLPEMFQNVNGLSLGSTQQGDEIGDVVLPPWADSAVDFVHKQRAALESEYVSSNLHHWIDLIFGYKQTGPEAVKAHNVFFYVTYEGAVDIDSIHNPVTRQGLQDQIKYFGQTPSHLFTAPHPKRIPLDRALHLQTIFRKPNEILPYVLPRPETLNVPAARLHATSDAIITVDHNVPACHIAVHQWQPNTPDGHGWPFLFQPGRASLSGGALLRMLKSSAPGFGAGSIVAGLGMGIGGTGLGGLSGGGGGAGGGLGGVGSGGGGGAGAAGAGGGGGGGMVSETSIYPRLLALPARGIRRPKELMAITPDGKHLITGGHADFSVKLISVESTRVVESAAVHTAPVTALSLSQEGATLVTGAADGTVMLWHVNTSASLAAAASSLAASMLGTADNSSQSFTGGPHDPSLVSTPEAATTSEEDEEEEEEREKEERRRRGSGSSPAAAAARMLSAAGRASLEQVKKKMRRLEGPVHVLRGHTDEVVCCAVSSDLDIAASSSLSSGVLLHSIMRGKFLCTLPGVARADVLAISPEGLVVVWELAMRALRVFTINAEPVAAVGVPEEDGDVSAVQISADGLYLVVGTDCTRWRYMREKERERERQRAAVMVGKSVGVRKVGGGEKRGKDGAGGEKEEEGEGLGRGGDGREPFEEEGLPNWRDSDEGGSKRERGSAISLLEIFTLKALYRFKLPESNDVTALALSADNTNLICSASVVLSPGHLILYSNPILSVKMVDQMLRLGWEGGGLQSMMQQPERASASPPVSTTPSSSSPAQSASTMSPARISGLYL